MTKIYTVGHSAHTQEHFLELLKSHNIDVLVDVRSYPGSRRYPHFNKENMSVWVDKNGIEYKHILKLGGRRNKIKGVDYDLVNAWEHPSFLNYAAYTLTDDYDEGIGELVALTENHKVCYFCSEHTHFKCHRRLVSDTLLSKGIEVMHILSNCTLKPHELTDFAVVENEHVIYPNKQLSLSI